MHNDVAKKAALVAPTRISKQHPVFYRTATFFGAGAAPGSKLDTGGIGGDRPSRIRHARCPIVELICHVFRFLVAGAAAGAVRWRWRQRQWRWRGEIPSDPLADLTGAAGGASGAGAAAASALVFGIACHR